MSVQQRTYQTSEAARAANMPQRKLRQLIDRQIAPLRGNDVKPNGSGNYCRLSRNRVIQVAIIGRLTNVGVGVSKAAEAALQFSDVGDWVRPPSEVFPIGKTLLVLVPHSPPAVTNSSYEANVGGLLESGAAVVVDLNRIVADVDAALNNFHK
jgi:hypothetical protein